MDIVTTTSDDYEDFDDTKLSALYKLYYDGDSNQGIDAGGEDGANDAISQVAAAFTKYYIDCDI